MLITIISGNKCVLTGDVFINHCVHTAEPLSAFPQLTPLPVVAAEGGSGESVWCTVHSSLSHTVY